MPRGVKRPYDKKKVLARARKCARFKRIDPMTDRIVCSMGDNVQLKSCMSCRHHPGFKVWDGSKIRKK